MKTRGTYSTGSVSGFARGALLGSLLVLPAGAAHADDLPFWVIVKETLTTSTQIYLNPDALDVVVRSQSFQVTNFYGTGAELRYRIPESNIAIGFSTEFVRARGLSTLQGTDIPLEDGYDVVPLEATGYFIIPFSGDRFGVFMGGGAGVYFGKRVYSLAGVEAPVVDSSPGFAIHVLGGVSYRFWGIFDALFEMKFRDLQFQSVNAFAQNSLQYNGVVINVSSVPFKSRVETDGVVFQIGLAVRF